MTPISDLLQRRLVRAHEALVQYGRVPVWHRQAIYAAFGQRYHGFALKQASRPGQPSLEELQEVNKGFPVYEDQAVSSAHFPPGQIRRAALMLATLRYGHMYIKGWSKSEYEEGLLLIFSAMRAVVAGKDWRSFSLSSGIGHYDAYVPGDFVYAAACYAWHAVSTDTEYRLHPLEPERNDSELAPFRYDTAEFIALALESQRTAVYSVNNHKVPRIPASTYWSWWLDEAVPSAWSAVSDLGARALL